MSEHYEIRTTKLNETQFFRAEAPILVGWYTTNLKYILLLCHQVKKVILDTDLQQNNWQVFWTTSPALPHSRKGSLKKQLFTKKAVNLML